MCKKFIFEVEVTAYEQGMFVQALIPYQRFLAVNLFDIRWTSNLKNRYLLTLTNDAPITAKPLHFKPQEEAWFSAHLGKLITNWGDWVYTSA